MKAAVLYEPNTPLRIEEFELPDLGPRHVRVRLVASGVCHSDWHVIKGEWPHIPIPSILGHEGAGVVEEVGSAVKGVAVGDHVVLSWKRNCGLCEMCQKGYPTSATSCPTSAPSRASPAASAGCGSSSGSAPSAPRPWCPTTW
jgi:S-(hydroxymethyl)glutathione dehydrogenase/alcohol dehydrogenase